MAFYPNLTRRVDGNHDCRESKAATEGNPVFICGFGCFGHAVGRLLRSRGFGGTVLDSDTDQVTLLHSIGVPVF